MDCPPPPLKLTCRVEGVPISCRPSCRGVPISCRPVHTVYSPTHAQAYQKLCAVKASKLADCFRPRRHIVALRRDMWHRHVPPICCPPPGHVTWTSLRLRDTSVLSAAGRCKRCAACTLFGSFEVGTYIINEYINMCCLNGFNGLLTEMPLILIVTVHTSSHACWSLY